MDLHIRITELKGVGPAVAEKLQRVGVRTASDLINYYPRRYDDYSHILKTSQIKPGHTVTIKAQVKQAMGRYVRRGMHITDAVASDDKGSIKLVWFNQPYRAKAIKPSETYFITGSFELSRGRLQIMNPSMELESSFPINTARILPVYRETKGLKSAQIRKILMNLRAEIAEIPDNLPKTISEQAGLMSHAEALSALHFPENIDDLSAAKKRLGFEELFTITLAGLLNKQQFASESGLQIKFDEKLAKQFVSKLPFDLTNAQRKVVWQIYKDFEDKTPMNRLVEGDVGSGKTVVAAMAAMMAIAEGFQVALMAPTELLARQHADSMYKLLQSIGMQEQVLLLVGSMKAAEKTAARQRIKDGSAKCLVGTHALITEKVDVDKLGLVVIDEQHRFGVNQRELLQKKAGHMPHVLSMTATPIPRTLALTLYGELSISILDEMPPGRKPTITKTVSPNSRAPMYKAIDQLLESGKQMFVVCPLIEESDKLDVLSAEKVYEQLSQHEFKHRRVGLLHGRLKSDEKDAIMQQFVDKKLDILVSTTVIEVGVDVPNATIMLVEGAERFGLAQIHQLRGRVGRGGQQGYCYLVMSDSKEPTRRLRALESTTDGFKLAELDLEIRGPGAIYGKMQSGQLDLRIANLSDTKLIAQVRKAAEEFIESKEKLSKYPELVREVQNNRAITNLN